MHRKTLGGGPPPEKPAMSGQPPIAGALALAFVPGKPFIDRIQRPDRDLGRAPNRARAARAIEQDDETPDDRRRLAARTKLTNQSLGGALDSGDHEFRQSCRHFRTISET